MAINTTFGSILNEIQLSNLNFSIQMTPFAAYIVSKKSAQKDLDGVPVSPSPPVLYLFQQAQQEYLALQDENYIEVKSWFRDAQEQKWYNCKWKHCIALRKKTEDKNKTIKANDDNLRSKFTLLEEKHSKSVATKATIEHN